MNSHFKAPSRVLSLLLTVLMLVSMIALPTTAASGTYTKTKHSYDIAIVFDNSGSMYNQFDCKNWCRAKYATEIFASMLNYSEGDKLTIFPMWQVMTDGSTPHHSTNAGSYEAIEIRNKSDIDKISNLYSVYPQTTPFEPVIDAKKYLERSNADEKWIIVLTDGEFSEKIRGDEYSTRYLTTGETIDTTLLLEWLYEVSTDEIKVQYLGFGDAAELRSNKEENFFAKKASATSLKDDLVTICNSIFQRDTLPSSKLSGSTLTIDLSMKNLIVFAQGSNAQITSLIDADGNPITVTLDSGRRQYSTISADQSMYFDQNPAKVDDTLMGQVVTFGACSAGKYTLNHSGADSIQIFYEPDVSIATVLTDENGNKIVAPSEGGIPPGNYYVKSTIVDNVTGDEVINHPLMQNGSPVSLKTYIKTSNDNDYKECGDQNAMVTFTPETEIDILVEGTYLKDYKITSDGDHNLRWLKGIKIISLDSIFMNAKTEQRGSLFTIGEEADWKPVVAELTYGGKPLTDAEMNNAVLTVESTGNLSCRWERIPGGSAYNIYLAQDSNGNFVQPNSGNYDIKLNVSYTDKYNEVTTSGTTVPVEFAYHVPELKIKAKVEQSQSWYTVMDHDNWKPIRVDVLVDGKPLTDQELDSLILTVDNTDGLNYRLEKVPGGSAYNIYIAQDNSGNYIEPECGDYKFKFKATYTDKYGQVCEDGDNASFDIQLVSKLLIWLKWIAIILAIVMLWLFYMTRKVMPKNIVKENAEFRTLTAGVQDGSMVSFSYSRKSKRIVIAGPSGADPDEQANATFMLKPLSNRFVPSRKRETAVVGISSIAERISIAGVDYINQEGAWVKSTQVGRANPEPVNKPIKPGAKFVIAREPGGVYASELECKMKTK